MFVLLDNKQAEMENYGVKKLSKLSGVSVRTLHYYDTIGLLKPSIRTEAGYRYYSMKELLRLQQVLFYRELDFPLKEIIELLDEPGFELVNALEKHRSALMVRKKRISNLLVTIDKTIYNLKKGGIMLQPEILYKGLPKEMGTSYRNDAMTKYGKETVENSERELLKLGKEGFEKLKKESERISNELFALLDENPESRKVQQVIALHYEIIRKFWGTSNLEDKQAEAYAGLGQLYVSDERYTTINGKPQPEYAAFIQKAMSHFADTQLKQV